MERRERRPRVSLRYQPPVRIRVHDARRGLRITTPATLAELTASARIGLGDETSGAEYDLRVRSSTSATSEGYRARLCRARSTSCIVSARGPNISSRTLVQEVPLSNRR